MIKNTLTTFFILFTLVVYASPSLAESKIPFIAKGNPKIECGIKRPNTDVVIKIVDDRDDKNLTSTNVTGQLEEKIMEYLDTCGYTVSNKEKAGTRILEIHLTDLSVNKDPGKIAGRMDAQATLKAVVVINGEQTYKTSLTATTSRTQPFVGHVIKKGKWALKLMDDLAQSVASDSPLNSELVKN